MAVGALGVLRDSRRNISNWSNGCFLHSHRIIETLDSTINVGQNIFFDFFRITTQIFIEIKVAWIFFEETKVSLSSCPTFLKAPKSESSLLSLHTFGDCSVSAPTDTIGVVIFLFSIVVISFQSVHCGSDKVNGVFWGTFARSLHMEVRSLQQIFSYGYSTQAALLQYGK